MSGSVKSGRSHTQWYAMASIDTCEGWQNTIQGLCGGVGRKDEGSYGDVRCGGRGRQMAGRTKLVRVGRLK